MYQTLVYTTVGKVYSFFLTLDKEIRWEHSLLESYDRLWSISMALQMINALVLIVIKVYGVLNKGDKIFVLVYRRLWDMFKYINIPQFKCIVHTHSSNV